MRWAKVQYGLRTHVIPEVDTVDHEIADPCWCQPRIDPGDDNTVLHNNFLFDEDRPSNNKPPGPLH
jgi:hypothetical protein